MIPRHRDAAAATPPAPTTGAQRRSMEYPHVILGSWSRSPPRSRRCSPAPSAGRRARSGRAVARSAATGTRWSRNSSAGPLLRPTCRWHPPTDRGRAASAKCAPTDHDRSRPGSASWTRCSAAAWSPGSVTLLGGEPGIGKSTLLLQLLAARNDTTLYVSAEESATQVRLRAERLDAIRPDLWAPCGDLASPRHPGDRRDQARAGRDRLDPDHGRSGPVLRTGLRRPGPRVRASLGERSQGARHRDRARRTRHQGRQSRRPTRPRTRGGHRAAVRRRPAPCAAPPASRETPVRTHQRTGPVRDDRRRPRRRTRSVDDVPRRSSHRRRRLRCGPHYGRAAPPSSSNSRRSRRRAWRTCRSGAARRASTADVSRC